VLGRQPLPDADSWARLGRGPVKGGGGDGGGLHAGVPGGVLAHDVLGPLWPTDGRHPLLMIGCPMGASGFEALASFFLDRTVVTQGPRGIAWGVVPEAEHTADERRGCAPGCACEQPGRSRSPESSLLTPVIAPATHPYFAGDLT